MGVDAQSIAEAIQLNLDKDCDVLVWDQGSFEISKTYIESLVDLARVVLQVEEPVLGPPFQLGEHELPRPVHQGLGEVAGGGAALGHEQGLAVIVTLLAGRREPASKAVASRG